MISPNRLRISQKIMLLVAGLAVGFVAIGTAYYAQIFTEQAITEQRSTLQKWDTLLNACKMDVDEQNRVLATLLKSQDISLLETHKALAALFRQRVLKLKNSEVAGVISADLRAIDGLLVTQDTHFQNLLAQLETLGRAGESGLYLEVTNAANMVTDVLQAAGNSAFTGQFFQLRFFEIGYLLSGKVTSYESFNTALINLVQNISQANLTDVQKNQIHSALDVYKSKIQLHTEAKSKFILFGDQARELGVQMAESVARASTHLAEYGQKSTDEANTKSQIAMVTFVGLGFVVLMLAAIGVFFIYKSIVFPMAHIQNVIHRINKGNVNARVKLLQNDELGDLGNTFNLLLDERIKYLEEKSLENEQLNNSIIELIVALGQIARKNLTIKVPVSADITGTISDAVNLLTSETAKTLAQVKEISDQVSLISDRVQAQSSVLVRVADDERKHVIAASKALELSAKTMNEIAVKASSADKIALKTITDTQAARDAVVRTVKGIQLIRETISETEKRMKRLGERSQEISGIVSLINTIAERTHILALNASMHAAAAGEAGKGFAVVADEVQRLAENAREATAEIASMVNNIRVETSDTVNIMNKLISEVADGTRLGEQAEQRMEVTEEATRQLVKTVEIISLSAVEQAQISNKLRDRANIIRHFTEKTGAELIKQKQDTDHLKQCAEVLLDRVNVFVLPDYLMAPLLEDAVDENPVVSQAS
jgi:twitching motility protein PilJ